jgi:hypothetical protein
MTDTYETTWGTPLGQDCVDLCSTLPRWLGDRLIFLGAHSTAAPASYYSASGEDAEHALESWKEDLIKHGLALGVVGNLSNFNLTIDEEEKAHEAADAAMLWVAANYRNLWD